MIPVRVKLQGFMPFRDEAVLNFDAVNLWMLSGRNGAGKSTIFDAITFALFGTGRFEGGDVMPYINQDVKRGNLPPGVGRTMSVEFDFEMGVRRYRIRRVCKVSGTDGREAATSTYEVRPLDSNRNEGSVILGTDKAGGFKEWVQRHLGLNCESFTASALLKQGQSDALITSTNTVRDAILRRIIRLGDYERLHAAVKAVSGRWTREQELLETRMAEDKRQILGAAQNAVETLELPSDAFPFQAMTPVGGRERDWVIPETDRQSVHRLIERLKSLQFDGKAEVVRLQTALNTLNTLRTHLAEWKKVQSSRAELVWNQAAYTEIRGRAGEIEWKFARWNELKKLNPPLQDWVQARTLWRTAHGQHEAICAAIRQLQDALDNLNSDLTGAQTTLKTAQEVHQEAVAQHATATAVRDALCARRVELGEAAGKAACQVCGKELTEAQRREQLEQVEDDLQEAIVLVNTLAAALNTAQTAVNSADNEVKSIVYAITRTTNLITKQDGLAGTEAEKMRSAEQRAQRAVTDLRSARAECAGLQVGEGPYKPKDICALLLAPPLDTVTMALKVGVYPGQADINAAKTEFEGLRRAEEGMKELAKARKEYGELEAQIKLLTAQIAGHERGIRDHTGGLEPTYGGALMEALDGAIQAITDTMCRIDAALGGSVAQAAGSPKTSADEMIVKIEEQKKALEGQTQKALLAHTALSSRIEEYEPRLPQQKEAARYALLYSTLMSKLSRQGVQSWVRKEAEKRIVEYADLTLQRLSNGMLTVCLAPNSNDTLDLRITDHEKDARDLNARALSGSQKFRLSVALALGIGQYACGSSEGGIQSVIIDEGFGSLDKEGSEQMIAELENLGKILKRIIVVSHQDEFKDAFPNRYRIFVDGKTSKAELEVA